MALLPDPITRGVKVAIAKHAGAVRAAGTAAEVESAFQTALAELGFSDRRLKLVRAALEERGRELCAAHPRGTCVPSFGPRRVLMVCGEAYRVPNGGNSTGRRYAWHSAREWATELMQEKGLSRKAAQYVWNCYGRYPHRALQTIEEFDAGQHQDPTLNVLIPWGDATVGPIRCEVGQDPNYPAHGPCGCGGTLFKWQTGHNDVFWWSSYRCNRCPKQFGEYYDDDEHQSRIAALIAKRTEPDAHRSGA